MLRRLISCRIIITIIIIIILTSHSTHVHYKSFRRRSSQPVFLTNHMAATSKQNKCRVYNRNQVTTQNTSTTMMITTNLHISGLTG